MHLALNTGLKSSRLFRYIRILETLPPPALYLSGRPRNRFLNVSKFTRTRSSIRSLRPQLEELLVLNFSTSQLLDYDPLKHILH